MRILSGVKPSRRPHLGNWFGAMRQFVDLQGGVKGERAEGFYFIANLHALDQVRNAAELREYTIGVALDYLALGLDPGRSTLFVQSDVPEIVELTWILGTVTPMGLLERMHAYKDATAKGRPADFGLFAYPVLMAADILLPAADLVPVGDDQKQHVEFARDVAVKFNQTHCPGFDPHTGKGGALKLPEPFILENVGTVPGTDGKKMSKSYGNTIELFATDKEVEKSIKRIVTDSRGVAEAKDPSTCNVFKILELFLSPDERAALERRYRAGGEGYGVYKQMLIDAFHARFDAARARRRELERDVGAVREILRRGAERAREEGSKTLRAVEEACGVRW